MDRSPMAAPSGVRCMALLALALGLGASACADPFASDSASDGGLFTEAGYSFAPCRAGADADQDGILDDVEGCGPNPVDTDHDGTPDYADVDADGDGIYDQLEGTGDTDGDGLADYKDTDADGDGIDDGEEDLNHDGLLGCCLATCGEARRDCPAVAADACGAGQTCAGGRCSPPAAFLCADGESDPRQQTTFPGNVADSALPTFICRKAREIDGKGLKAIDFHTSAAGDFKIALEANTPVGELSIAGAVAQEAAAAFDYGQADRAVAGLVVSLPATGVTEIVDLSVALINKLKSDLAGATSVTQLSSGNRIESHDRYPTIVSSQIALKLGAAQTAGAVRNALYEALLGKAVQQGGQENYGPATTDHVLRFQTQLRPDGRLLLLGGVAAAAMANDVTQATGYLLDDLSNGTGLATPADSDTVECDPFRLDSNPVADIIWVVDESGSMSDNLQDIVNNAKDFFARALSSGLDFRMGVTSVADPNGGDPFSPPVVVGKLCSAAQPVGLFPDFGDGGPDRFLLSSEQAAFESCVGNPPYNEGGSEYGLAHAIEAVTRHLPRTANDPAKIRPNATVVIIIATDEAPEELKGGTYRGITGPTYEAEGCNLVAQSQQAVDQYLKLWIDLFTGQDPTWKEQGKAIVHLIGGLCTSGSCNPEIGHGYLELVRATGGLTADICQEDLGATLQIIIDSISGAASKAVLQYVPISASLAVARGDQTLARSRVSGFDYVGFSNSLVFVGVKIQPGDQIVASYRRWVKQAAIK